MRYLFTLLESVRKVLPPSTVVKPLSRTRHSILNREGWFRVNEHEQVLPPSTGASEIYYWQLVLNSYSQRHLFPIFEPNGTNEPKFGCNVL